jgi:hypothetical protein
MKKRWKITLATFGVMLLVPAIAIIVFSYLLKGPYSQAALVVKYEQNNLDALRRARLPTVTNLPSARAEYPRPWAYVTGFTPPIWPKFRLLQFFTRNGPLEGTPYERNRGIIYNEIAMIETHGWMNGKDWGLAYTTTTNRLPAPYWTKHLTGNWSVWYTDGNRPPERDGLWYE